MTYAYKTHPVSFSFRSCANPLRTPRRRTLYITPRLRYSNKKKCPDSCFKRFVSCTIGSDANGVLSGGKQQKKKKSRPLLLLRWRRPRRRRWIRPLLPPSPLYLLLRRMHSSGARRNCHQHAGAIYVQQHAYTPRHTSPPTVLHTRVLCP